MKSMHSTLPQTNKSVSDAGDGILTRTRAPGVTAATNHAEAREMVDAALSTSSSVLWAGRLSEMAGQ